MYLRSSLAVLLLGSLFASSACDPDSDAIEGNGAIVSESRIVSEFTGVSISDELDAEIALGPTAVTVEMDANLLRRVSTEVRNGVLFIEPLPGGPALRPTAKARVRVTAPNIDAISASEAASVSAQTNAGAVTISATDAAHVELAGVASAVSISSSGAARVDCQTMASRADVESNEGSEVRVQVTGYLAARAHDAAKITVTGEPTTRDVNVTDAATIIFSE